MVFKILPLFIDNTSRLGCCGKVAPVVVAPHPSPRHPTSDLLSCSNVIDLRSNASLA